MNIFSSFYQRGREYFILHSVKVEAKNPYVSRLCLEGIIKCASVLKLEDLFHYDIVLISFQVNFK